MQPPTAADRVAFTFLPEELIERILAIALSPLAQPTRPALYTPRPSWHTSLSDQTPLCTNANNLGLLLLSHQLNRIATPLLYTRVTLHSHTQADRLDRTLRARPDLAPRVRWVIAGGCWEEVADVLACLGGDGDAGLGLEVLDLMIDTDHLFRDAVRPYLRTFVSALQGLTGLRHLVLRKEHCTYLTLPKVRYMITGFGEAIAGWPKLVRFSSPLRCDSEMKGFEYM
jgi:hypothetical protein